jgi:hypothetical protein
MHSTKLRARKSRSANVQARKIEERGKRVRKIKERGSANAKVQNLNQKKSAKAQAHRASPKSAKA